MNEVLVKLENMLVKDRPLPTAVYSLDASEIAQALPFPKLIAGMALSLANMAPAPLRLHLNGIEQRELLVMPAMSARFSSVKVLTITPDNSRSSLPVIDGLFVFFDGQSGAVLAMMDASELTARRTAALSAIAASKLARIDSQTLVILGTGHLAPYLADAHCIARPIQKVAVWGRDRKKMETTCAKVRQRLPGMDVCPVLNLSETIRQSDIICAATRSVEPLILGDWISPGTHIDLVGGYRADMREIDDVGIAKSTIYVDTLEGALTEAGDLRSPIERGVISQEYIVGDIGTLLKGNGRNSMTEITLFKSVGNAAWDLVAAELAWETYHG